MTEHKPLVIILGIFFLLCAISAVFFNNNLSVVEQLKQNEQNSANQTVLPTQTEAPAISSFPTPASYLKKDKQYSAVLKTTEGNIEIELFAEQTPVTVNNFIHLAKNNFYNNTIFHRVIKGFMIQGGDPKGNGTGGPGYRFNDEPFSGEYTRGTVAMANSGPNTNGSQFFIVHQDSLSLPKNYVIFGKVSQGLEVVDAIASGKVELNSNQEMSKPVNPVKILSVEIKEK